MAAREQRREQRRTQTAQDEQARVAQPPQARGQPQRPRAMRPAPPRQAPSVRAVQDTAKAEAEVRRGAEVAKGITRKLDERPSVLPAAPKGTALPKATSQQSSSPGTEHATGARQEVQARGLAARIRSRREEGVRPASPEARPVEAERQPEALPHHPAPAHKPPSKMKRAWDSFLGFLGFSKRPGPVHSEPERDEPRETRPRAKAVVAPLNVSSDGMAQGAPPPDDGRPSGRVPVIDFATVGISLFDPGIRIRQQLPGVEARDALSAQRAITENRGTLAAYEARVRGILRQHPEAFTPAKSIAIGDKEVSICKPILIGRDVRDAREDLAVPIYITSGGATRMVMCYRSQSQGTWRRFAGCDNEYGHYYKGPEADSEALQDLDWRIQKGIDSLMEAGRPAVLPSVSLGEFGPRPADGKNASLLVVAMENALQSSALNGARSLDLSGPGSMPSKVVDFWMAGSDEDFYGRHVNLLLESADGRYLYGVAATDLGMFVQFVHDRESPSVGSGGSPSRGVAIPEQSGWLLTPIIEYSIQTSEIGKRRLSKLERRKTVVAGGARSYVLGVHSSSGSPLFRIDNAISPVYSMLRSGAFGDAESFLRDVKSGRRPFSSNDRPAQLPLDKVNALAQPRFEKLKAAYAAHSSRSATDEEIMNRYSVGRRDILVFERYEESARDYLIEGRWFRKQVSSRVSSVERAIGSLGKPLDAEGAARVIRDARLEGKVAEAVAKLAGVDDPARRKRELAGAVRESLRERITQLTSEQLEDRLMWQATLWARAELATGRGG